MSQPPTTYSPTQAEPAQSAPAPARRSVGSHLLVGAISGIAGIGLGLTIGVGGVSSQPHPQPTVAVSAPTSQFSASPADFRVSLKILSEQCFGESGCSYKYRIQPQYVGTRALPTSGTVEVSYEVTGTDGAPAVNTFTVKNGIASYDDEEIATTPTTDTELAVTVTDVSYTP